jgi:hypothetical protein
MNSLEYFLAVCAKLKVVVSANSMRKLFFKLKSIYKYKGCDFLPKIYIFTDVPTLFF